MTDERLTACCVLMTCDKIIRQLHEAHYDAGCTFCKESRSRPAQRPR